MKAVNLPTIDRVTSPAAVVLGANIVSNFLRLASTVILTRLLSPHDFGSVAIIASVFSAIAMITDAGFQAFVVRHERGDESYFLDVIWTIHLARGVFNAIIAVSLAVPVSVLLDKPGLAPLVVAAAITIAIDGAASLSLLSALRRNFVRRLSFIELAAQFAQVIVGIGAAWLLRNAWALIVSMIAASLVRTLASYAAFPNADRRLRWDWTLAADLWRFSRLVAISSLLTLAILQVDKIILARVFTLEQFGIYAIAATLAAAPLAIAYQYSSRIFYPAIAETWRESPARLRRVYYDLRGFLYYSYLVGGGILIGCAPVIVRIIYDPRYSEAGHYLRMLAVSTTVAIMTDNANSALTAIGRIQTTLNANLIRVGWLLLIGSSAFFALGPIGLIAALALIELPAYLYMSANLAVSGLFDVRRELPSWLAIAFGASVGFGFASVMNYVLQI